MSPTSTPAGEQHYTIAPDSAHTWHVYAAEGTLAAIVRRPPGRPTVALTSIMGVPAREADRPVALADTYNYADTNYLDLAPYVQAELAKGPRIISWDKAVTMTQLLLGSGHTLQATAPSKGAILRRTPASNALGFVSTYLLANKHPSFGPIQDENITLSGGTWNGKGPDQVATDDTGFLGILKMWGVRNLLVENCTFAYAKTFATHFANIENGTFRGITVQGGNNLPNTDGLHFNAGLNGALVENCTFIDLKDDSLAFNGSSDPLASYFGPNCHLYDALKNALPFQNVTVRGITFQHTRWGQRMLIAATQFRNFACSNYTGTTTDYWLVLDNFPLSNQTLPAAAPGVTYAKNLRWSDIDVQVANDPSDDNLRRLGCALVSCNTDVVGFQRIRRTDFSANWCSLRIMGFAHTTLSYDNYTATDTSAASAYTAPHVLVDEVYDGYTHNRATLARLNVRHAVQQRAAAAAPGSALVQLAQADVTYLDLSGSRAQNVQHLVRVAGSTVGTLDLSGTAHTGGIKRVYLAADASIGTVRYVGYAGSLASLVDGPGAARAARLQTR